MDLKIRLFIILIISLAFVQVNIVGQTTTKTERTIFLMRAKQFYGSGAKMDLMINGEIIHKIKSGTRLIIKANSNDTLSFQIIYPLGKKHKSKVLQITPDDEAEIYIDLYYWGEGYNPMKHVGVLNPTGGTPEFNIEIVEMDLDKGKEKFNQTDLYKDNNKIIEKRFL